MNLAYLEAAMAGDRDDWFVACSLRAELEAARLSPAALARVLELGVPAGLLGQLCGAGDIGAGRVALSADGARFEPEGPDPRLLLGVREQGVLVDLVALATHDPDQWALRWGQGWCLGYDAWLACETGRAHELRLFATPLAWLRAGGVGIVILDWDEGLRCLRGLGEHVLLRCDRGAGERLRKLLSIGNLPRVKETGPVVPVRRAA
ncbi:hypothetical protein K3172_13015 [Qipengyuania sp. 6B39]|uniref:hypothetical protein n=1 Tax=Qipengyuania proteolytica TaxID=2867239 RepID=UPI001C893B07|nr:hypothetical protein [Qipengyuania proteolytica]MBX7496780.1 hypothetical protein [Qipengyuania proteolytica]